MDSILTEYQKRNKNSEENTMEYKRLGDYIRPVDVRNRDLKVTELLGLSIEKKFIPSIANTIGTDMSTYKIVRPTQFAYVPVTSRNGDKITVALYEGAEPVLISQAYTVFEITDHNALLPEYLMMWFRRPEFDRYARFHSHGSAREVFDWDELCDVQLPVPSIERQREIVSEYETLTRRICLNNQMIEKLEATAQALYRHTFVDNIDKQNLPQGWRMGTLGDIFNVTIGRTPPRAEEQWFADSKETSETMQWVSIADMGNEPFICKTRERLINEAAKRFNIPVVPKDSVLLSFKMTVGRVAITTGDTLTNEAIAHFVCNGRPQLREYIYLYLKNVDFKSQGSTSSITEAVNTNMIKQMEIMLPIDNVLISFHKQQKTIFNDIYLRQKENDKLTELQSLLLARMGKK